MLPAAFIRRLARYVQEGRQLRAVFGQSGYRLLAVAEGRPPVVVLWTAAAEQFAALRNAVLLEWGRILKQLRQKEQEGARQEDKQSRGAQLGGLGWTSVEGPDAGGVLNPAVGRRSRCRSDEPPACPP